MRVTSAMHKITYWSGLKIKKKWFTVCCVDFLALSLFQTHFAKKKLNDFPVRLFLCMVISGTTTTVWHLTFLECFFFILVRLFATIFLELNLTCHSHFILTEKNMIMIDGLNSRYIIETYISPNFCYPSLFLMNFNQIVAIDLNWNKLTIQLYFLTSILSLFYFLNCLQIWFLWSA